MSNISLHFFGRAAVDEVKVFSNPIWKSTALITRLNFQFSHRYAHKHTHTHSHTQNTKWGRGTKQSPRQAQWYKKHTQDKKEKTVIMWGWSGIVVTTHTLLYKEETQHLSLQQRMCTAQTRHGCLHHITWGCCVVKWSTSGSTEAGYRPLCHPRVGSCNCRGSVQSGSVFVSALISIPCLVPFIETRSCGSRPAFHLTARGESF